MSLIAVTGAAGFLGRRVVAALRSRGHAVRAIVRRSAQAGVVRSTGAEIALADMTDDAALDAALGGAERLVHLAAIIRERRGATFQSVNVNGVEQVFRAAARAGAARSVLASVISADANAREPYLASRGAGERIALESGIPTSVVRFSALFGEGDEFFNVIAALVRLGPLVIVPGNGKARFQPLDARDAAEAIVRSVLHDPPDEGIAEMGGPDVVTYDQILELIAETLGRSVVKVHAPLPVLAPVARLMNAAMPTPPVTPHQLRMLRLDNVANDARQARDFGFTPRPMRGNIDYVRRVGFREAVAILTGRMPRHIRDH